MFAFIASPYIATVWVTGPIAQAWIDGPGFRWSFGAWAIITPMTSLPLYILIQRNTRKAIKQGLMPAQRSGRTTLQSIKHYAVEYDVLGLLLLCAGFALFLLPFSIYSYQAQGWQSPMIICMIVFGILFLISFVLWEVFGATVNFFPWHLLKDRTVLGCNILAAVLFIEFYIWNSYFTSFLQVVPGMNLTQTGYISNIYSIGSCFLAIFSGLYLRKTGDFKKQSLFFGLPLTLLGVGLMIHFRQPDVNIGYIVMCQIFVSGLPSRRIKRIADFDASIQIAFGGGCLVITQQVGAMAATTHQYVAVVLAVEGMFSSVGGAIGATVAAAIWTGKFYPSLLRLLPAESLDQAATIYGDLEVQMSYPLGTPTRDAINQAYGESQMIMCVAATAILALAVAAVFMFKDIDVRARKQVKGLVF